MPMMPGYYMPNYYASQYPGATYPASNTGMQWPQQSYTPPVQPQQNSQGIIWVDGEVGAKAYQMPQGWPAGSPVPLWDTNDTVIYLKSINQMGMPNPLQKIHYTMEEVQNQSMLPAGGMSGNTSQTDAYATKHDLEAMKNELKELLKTQQPQPNQNGRNNGQNQGGGNR